MSDPVFFRFRRVLPPSIADILAWSEAKVLPGTDLTLLVRSVASLEDAGPGALTFAASAQDLVGLARSRAAACFVAPEHASEVPAGTIALLTDAPARDFALTAARMFPAALHTQSVFGSAGISPGVAVHPEARLEPDVIVDPGAVIGARAEIGTGTIVGANAVIGADVRIGRGCAIGAAATVTTALLGDRVTIGDGARIGGKGFSFAEGAAGVHLNVPQVGRVILQDDVDIGANTTVDRGGHRDTVIGEGTKIGNLVVVARNARIGRHCLVASQTSIQEAADIADFSSLRACDAAPGDQG
jgi:UDP-3-O-[3-hydroxymyristoyl] glucosamine N-acyltransferase